MSTINFNFFRFSWKFIFIGQFFILICNFRIIFIVVYCVVFIIRLFAGWRYAGRIFNAVSAREGDLRVPQPERLPRAPTLLGTEEVLRCCVCCVVDFLSVCCGTQNGTLCRSGFCILRYLWWYAVPICDLVLGFFGTYSGTLGRSGPCILRYL